MVVFFISVLYKTIRQSAAFAMFYTNPLSRIPKSLSKRRGVIDVPRMWKHNGLGKNADRAISRAQYLLKTPLSVKIRISWMPLARGRWQKRLEGWEEKVPPRRSVPLSLKNLTPEHNRSPALIEKAGPFRPEARLFYDAAAITQRSKLWQTFRLHDDTGGVCKSISTI